MQISKSTFAKPGIVALVALTALAGASPALAIQSDATIDQIPAAPAKGAWLVDQIGAPVPATTYLVQVGAPDVNPDVSFQANLATFTTQLTMADQVPGDAQSWGAPVELAFLGYGLDLGRFVRTGQGTSFASDDFDNSQQHAWNGSENLQASLQRGDQNRSLQSQTGFRNVSLVVQDGTANIAETVQSTDYALASILQVGSRNSASIQQGTASSFALVSQAGIGNVVSIRQ